MVLTASPGIELCPQVGLPTSGRRLTTVGLFAGVGGIEYGLAKAGHSTDLFCEIDPAARNVLKTRFPGVPCATDITQLQSLPKCDVVTAGFPCQDLSQAGRKAGIEGQKSGLISEVFRLLETAISTSSDPDWVLIENVQYMLRLARGGAMERITSEFSRLGYRWAYRVVDARGFSIPQRRLRVLFVASRMHDPREVLFADAVDAPDGIDAIGPTSRDSTYGFYWTEGARGLGWAVDAVPTIKGGSRIGIPSPPAIWYPQIDAVATPSLQDSERLQGFPADWTRTCEEEDRRARGHRWTLVGNAVCTPMAAWVGDRLSRPGVFDPCGNYELPRAWPNAAWGDANERYAYDISTRVKSSAHPPLSTFLIDDPTPLSLRATAGFLRRARSSNLRFNDDFLDSMDRHLQTQTDRNCR